MDYITAMAHQALPAELLAGGLFTVMWIAIMLWSLYWKGVALWKAARLYDKNWFIVLLVVDIFGVLQIFYIYRIAKPKEDKLRAELETK